MIDDICPGAFAEPETVTLWMRTGQEHVDWRAAERETWAALGLGPVFDSVQRDREERTLAFLRYEPSPMARWICEMVGSGAAKITTPDPDAFTFTIAPIKIAPPCGACRGSGEIIEFPADEDERLVACPRCGGSGEGIPA